MFWKPASAMGVSAASVPPVTITSASPYWIIRRAAPIELAALAQAVAMAMFGPLIPKSVETWPLAELRSSFGMKKGDTLSTPLSTIRANCVSNSCSPPIPEPMATPQR